VRHNTERKDDAFSSNRFEWNERTNKYRCPTGMRFAVIGVNLKNSEGVLPVPI